MIFEYDCIVCGTHVRKRRSPANVKTEPKFCSQKCNGEYKRGKGNGPTPNTFYNCKQCGKRVETYRSPQNKKDAEPKYCSLKCIGLAQIGENNPSYNSGKHIMNTGYVAVLQPNHPNADDRGYVLEHRLVMEQKIGRFLKGEEVVHHIDRDKTNNHPDNLMLFESNAAHLRHHWEEYRNGIKST